MHSGGQKHGETANSEAASESPLLQKATRAYQEGDFAATRSHCQELLGSGDPNLEAAASELMRRTGIDPVQWIVWGGCLLFFCWVVWRYAL